jgi:hypothetical protein
MLTGPALGAGLRDREPRNRLGRDPFLLETSLPGVFAVGDVRSGGTRMGAPAVGEGGMAGPPRRRAPRPHQRLITQTLGVTRGAGATPTFRGAVPHLRRARHSCSSSAYMSCFAIRS